MDESSITSESHIPGENVRCLQLNGRRFTVIGVGLTFEPDLLFDFLNQSRPDRVYLELDMRRFESLSESAGWLNRDLRDVIRQQHVGTLIAQIVLMSYQRKMGDQRGGDPGLPLFEIAQHCDQNKIPYELADRDIRTTMLRAWRNTPGRHKPWLLATVISALLDPTQRTEEHLKQHRDPLSSLLDDFSQSFPALVTVLRDERNQFIADKVRSSKAEHAAIVVTRGHLEGIIERLQESHDNTASCLDTIPKASPTVKRIAWLLPLVIIGSIVLIAVRKGPAAAGENVLYWFLANSIPCALGAVVALAHPWTILTAFVAAPFTSLTPIFGAGYAAAMVETWFRPPRIREIHDVSQDAVVVRRWWRNRLLRILLVFFLTGLGSMIGTAVGGVEIIKNVF